MFRGFDFNLFLNNDELFSVYALKGFEDFELYIGGFQVLVYPVIQVCDLFNLMGDI